MAIGLRYLSQALAAAGPAPTAARAVRELDDRRGEGAAVSNLAIFARQSGDPVGSVALQCYSAGMETIGVRELRQNASRYLRLVKAGERVAVTERGELIAYLVPASEAPGSILDRLEAAGQLRRGIGSLAEVVSPAQLPPGARSPSEVLDEMRNEERW
jgi:prevent-host-death family protein